MKKLTLAALALSLTMCVASHAAKRESLESANKRCLRLSEKSTKTFKRQLKVWDRCMKKAGWSDQCGTTLECE
jgi:hypothetical protein